MRALKILLGLVLLLVILVLALVLTFDPNKYKPEIIQAAADQRVVLKIDGELGWQLWPRIAIRANGVSVASPAAPAEPIAAIDAFALSVQLMPLFRGEIKVDGVDLTGADINLKTNARGLGNWQGLGPQASRAQPAAELRYAVAQPADLAGARNVADQAFNPGALQLSRLSLNQSKLRYRTAEGLDLQLTGINANVRDLRLDGSPVPVTLSTAFDLVRPEAAPLKGQLDSSLVLKLPASLDQIVIEDLKAPVALSKGPQLERLVLNASATVNLAPALTYSGQLDLATVNLQKLMQVMGTPLPAMADPAALQAISLSSPFTGSDKQLVLEPAQIGLDSSNLRGKLAITDFSQTALLVDIQGDQIDLDNYLPPPAPPANAGSGAKKQAPAPVAAGDALPLEALRALNLDLTAGLDRLTANKLPFEQVALKLDAHQGLIQLKSLKARLHGGPLSADGVFDARKDKATLSFNAKGDRLPLQTLLEDFEVAPLVSGNGQVSVKGQAAGRTSSALTDSLRADIQLTSQQMQLNNMNLERSLCELAMLAQKQEMPAIAWADHTKLQSLSSKLTFAGQRLTIESLDSGVESMLMKGLGFVDLNKNALDFKFNLRIDEAANKLLNCPIVNKKLLNRDIPIRCKDSFAKLGARSCAPDLAMLEDLYKDEVKQKLGKELDKALEKNPDAKQLLEGLFGPKKKKTDGQ